MLRLFLLAAIATFTALPSTALAGEPAKRVDFRTGKQSLTASLHLGKNSGFGFVAVGSPPEVATDIMPIWDLQAADLDGDGIDELLVGTWSRRGPQRSATQRTIWVMRWDGERLRPLWRGSRLPHGFERFVTKPGKSGAELITFATGPGIAPTRYRWTGFGFTSNRRGTALRLVFVGDTTIARGDPLKTLQPTASALEAVRTADIAIANLEASVGTAGESERPPPDPIRPDLLLQPEHLQKLSDWGIDAVTRANNHALDGGQSGWLRTSRALRGLGIGDLTGRSLGPVAPGISILAATRHPPKARSPFPVVTDGKSEDAFIDAVRREARLQTVIVSLHGGSEGHRGPKAADRRFTRRLIGAGAAVVVWHGAHRAARSELVDGAIVAWNLGDFALKQTNDGCALHILLLPSGVLRMTSGPWACEQ